MSGNYSSRAVRWREVVGSTESRQGTSGGKHVWPVRVLDKSGLAREGAQWQDGCELLAGPPGRGGAGTRMRIAK